MRKLLLFFAMLTVSIGTWAAPTISGSGTVTLSGFQAGQLAKALNGETVEGLTGSVDALKNATKIVFGDAEQNKLNDDDLSALIACSKATQLDMSKAKLDAGADIANLETAAVEYLQLPDGMTKEDDVKKMATLRTKNPALNVVGAFDGSNSTLPELALYSFKANELSNFSSNFMNLACNAIVARLAGTFGDKDLVNGDPVFGWNNDSGNSPCIWDFTGATFTSCTLNPGVGEYHALDDPFCKNPTSKPGDNYQTNAFFYFSNYSTSVVDIKLPTGITALPPHSLNDLGAQNLEKDAHKAAYKAYYKVSDADLEGELKVPEKTAAIIPTLTVPDNYVTLDYECGTAAHIKHLVVGSGIKAIQGGAFYNCLQLEDLDFAAGISDCYLGEDAFRGQANSVMTHIALSEGIVSVGANCFKNAQHLESIRLPQTLKYIGNHAFDNCLALNSITIPENVEQIGQNAFELCPFTDIYLTTTDPAKIPYIWTAGTSFDPKDKKATFYSPDFDGNNGIPNQANEIPSMSWDEAVQWYYVRANGIPVLHYPKELAEKVRADISKTYGGHTNDNPAYGLPLQGDRPKRANIEGADLGSAGTGTYSQDGWAQFMLMKEFTTDPGGDVYTKQYEDVWYTMCFPFDLTDEQLAAAFNETFNIVDFSGVEIKEADEGAGTPKKLVLHFNNVAKTYYRDNKGNEYEVIGREVDPVSKFSYNIYKRDGVEYHHSQVSDLLSTNKTKTFAPGNSITESNANKANAIIIDGVLATAGHPYMIHPAIGTSIGNPKRCDFSGIDWKPMTQWASIFETQKRTVNLGVQKGTINESDPTKSTPDADNYLQAAYSKYAGQTYTFIGNAKEYRDDAQALGDEPLVPEEPKEPVAPEEPSETLTAPTETISAPTPLTADEQELISLLTDGQDQYNRGPWYGITVEITANYNDGSDQANRYNQQFHIISGKLQQLGYDVYNGDAVAAFDYCKTTFNKNISYASDYAAYLENKALWDAYEANQAAWARYNAWQADNGESEWAVYRPLKQAYDEAVAAHDTWVENAKGWLTYIPKNAYFLGRKGTALPKYYREVAENPAEGQASTRKGGVWTQFTAIVIPNDAAVAGIESELDGKTASSKGFDMAFDEGFLGDFIEQDDVVTLIEKAQEEGAKVEYMDIVVSINGQVVRRGTTSLEGLPKGMYIINGKKYFVK